MDRGYGTVTEPVGRFQHSRRSPLVVFASFEPFSIAHIANGRKGSSAGTDLVRLNLEDLQPLKSPIAHENGGVLPPKTLGAMVDAITKLDDTVAPRLTRFSERRRERIRAIPRWSRENLALQKESVGIALEIAGLPKDELLTWSPRGRPS